jgi:ring-1,2-phenylacetyl-CoA epoxidase subunit PaaC
MITKNEALTKYCLRLGDSSLILGQRMAEWCSRGPVLEEDIALSNIGLDLFGQSRTMLTYAGELEGKGRTENDLAFKRLEREFLNNLLSERPNGHFGDTVTRNLFISAFSYHLYTALTKSADITISAFAAKSLKEVTYHLRHSGEWMIRLGDGTKESHDKIQQSINELWEYTDDLFAMNEVDQLLIADNIAIDLNEIKPLWNKTVNDVFQRATLSIPESVFMQKGSLEGMHSEDLGHLLTEMQYLPRAYPDAKW